MRLQPITLDAEPMPREPADLCMMKVALADARRRIAETGGAPRDRWIVGHYEGLDLSPDERLAIGL